MKDSIKILYEIVMQKYDKCKRQYEKDHETIVIFDNLYRKCLQDNVIDKSEYESLCNIFTKFVDETKNKSFS